MSLRTKLVIEGDAEGAKKAAQDAQRAMGDTQRQTRDYQRGAMGAARQGGLLAAANDNVATSFRNAAGSIAIIHGPLGGVASRFSAAATLAGRLGVAGGVAAVGIGAATFAAQRGVRAFADYERQQLTSEQVIRATGMAAGRTAQDIEQLSREIGLNTLAATNEVRQAAGQLLTFRSIAGETFDRTMRAAQDLAAVGFGSVSSSAVQLARALEEPEQGVTRLSRAGISFSQTQREQIRNFMETGRVADAQRLILAQVERQVGGAGVGAAGGLAGAFDSLTEQSGRWFEMVGRRTADVLRLREGLNWLAEAIGNVNAAMADAGTPTEALTVLRQQERDTRAVIAAQREHLEFMRSSGYTDAQIEMEAPGLLSEINSLETIRERIREVERLDEQLRRMDTRRSETAMQSAQREQRQGRIDGVIDTLRQEAEALGRSELAQLQYDAARRAGVALDSEAGQQIAQLVRHNYELAEAQRQAAAADEDSLRKHEAGRQAVRDLITELDRELEILRETDPVQREMIRLRDEMAYATSREIEQIREKVGALETEREAQKATDQAMASRRSMTEGIIGDIRRVIRDGRIEWERFADVGLNALDRMIDKMQNELLDAIFKVNNAVGGSGGGGWFAQLIGSLFGGGGMSLSPAAAGAIAAGGGGLYDRGGYTGPGAKHDVAGVVHRDEFVFSKEATQRLGVGALQQLHEAAKRGSGFAEGGYAGPLSAAVSGGASGGMAGALTLRLEIENHSQARVEAGTPRQQGDEIVMPMMIREIESAMAGSVQGNGPLGKAVQQTFNLQRVTR